MAAAPKRCVNDAAEILATNIGRANPATLAVDKGTGFGERSIRTMGFAALNPSYGLINPILALRAGIVDLLFGGVRAYRALNDSNDLVDTRRPEGIPDDWIVKPTPKENGTKYYNPTNAQDNVRVMDGNPNSPNPFQQEPYVKDQINGQFLTTSGSRVQGGDKPETHIPIKDYRYRR